MFIPLFRVEIAWKPSEVSCFLSLSLLSIFFLTSCYCCSWTTMTSMLVVAAPSPVDAAERFQPVAGAGSAKEKGCSCSSYALHSPNALQTGTPNFLQLTTWLLQEIVGGILTQWLLTAPSSRSAVAKLEVTWTELRCKGHILARALPTRARAASACWLGGCADGPARRVHSEPLGLYSNPSACR